MKKKIPTLLSYNSQKSNDIQKQSFPLTSRMPVLTDYNSSSLINNPLTTMQAISKKKYNSINSKKYKIDKKLLYIFKDPKEKYKKKFKWPKITHAKLPFSERHTLSLEERKKKIMEQKPSNLFHNFYTIKWLRQKYSDSLIEKSVFSMLPDNGKPVVPDDESEEDKKHRLLMEYLENLYTKTPEREKYVNINPKYFFDRRTFEKILKFKEIFLEFDEDQSRKMEIDEMVEMFNQNHINANLRDLVNLFFKGQNIKEEDIMKLYLDFYQFMNFALTKDQDFREFMREIKLKSKKKDEGFNTNENEDESNGYLPMNFNLMFDYFLVKGKERASIEAIENSINEMDKIINNNKSEEDLVGDNNEDLKRKNSIESNRIQIEEENNEQAKYYDEQLKNLNFCDLIENFTNLFNVNDLTDNNRDNKKELSCNNNDNNEKNENETKNKNNNILNNETEEAVTEFLQNKMNKNVIKKLNIKNYKKYRNVKLALNETKEQIKTFIKSNGNKVDNLYKIQLDTEKENNEQMQTVNNILPFFYEKSKRNNSNNINNKNIIKNKTLLLFNRNRNRLETKEIKDKRTLSIVNERKIKILDNHIYQRNRDFINNYFSKNNYRTKNTTNKLDYVPLELLK